MPRRSPAINPELRAHKEWLGYLQPVGLVVAPAAMVDAGWVVTRSGSELIERQERIDSGELFFWVADEPERRALRRRGGPGAAWQGREEAIRSRSPAKAANSADTEQIGLAL